MILVLKWGYKMQGHHGKGDKKKMNWNMVAAAILMWIKNRIFSKYKLATFSRRFFTLWTRFRKKIRSVTSTCQKCILQNPSHCQSERIQIHSKSVNCTEPVKK